jgi:histidinol-phosphate aminotransferase
VCVIGAHYGYVDNISSKIINYSDCHDKESYILYIASPNNPDSVTYTHEQIRDFCKEFKMVIVDEAYIEFMGLEYTAASLKIDNLFVTRTFSKAFGLASIRVGYIISNGLGRELQYKINPKNFSPLVGVINILLDNVTYYEQCVRDLRIAAAEFFDKIREKFEIIGGENSNFYMIKLPDTAAQIFEDNGILVRPRDGGLVRITLGTKEDNDAVLEVLMKFLPSYIERV